MPKKATILRTLMITAVMALAIQSAGAQNNTLDRAKVVRAAADALGMVRWSDIGADATRLPGIDVVNTMEFEATGTGYTYHASLGYNPAAMRVERTGPTGPQHTIQTVREAYAWNESEIGA